MTGSIRRAARYFAAVTVFVLAAGGAATVAEAAPCSSQCLQAGDYNLTLTTEQGVRQYKVHVPAAYDGRAAVALTLDLHGHGYTSDDQMNRSGQRQEADRLGFIVVWPQGIGYGWNGEGCCGVAFDLNVDDVGFLRNVISQMMVRANIDPEKVYVTGWSNGGGMAQRMGCEASDVVRAIAPVSHPLNTNTCRPARPLSVLAFHGTADTTVPYDGRGDVLPRQVLGIPLGWQGARQSLAAWKSTLGCTAELTGRQLNGASRDETYLTCSSGTTAGLVTVANGEHDLYHPSTLMQIGLGGDPGHIDVAPYIWNHVFRP